MIYFFDSGLTQGTTEQQVDGACCSKDSQVNSGKKGLTQGTTEQQVDGAGCSKDSQDNSGKKVHQCTECRKCLSTNSSLYNHSLIYSGVQPHKC
jgi:uncharacterized Zn-finger protein